MNIQFLRTLPALFALFCLSSPTWSQPPADFEKGIQALRSNQVDDAIIHFKNTLQLSPDFLPARTQLGLLYLKSSQLEAAHETLTTALGQGADPSMLVPVLLEVYAKQGKESEARTLITTYPQAGSLAQSKYWMAVLLHGQRKSEQAIALLDSLIDSPPSQPLFLFERGRIAVNQDDWETVAAINEALKAHSNGQFHHLVLQAMLAAEQVDYKRAHQLLSDALQHSPDDPTALFLYAHVSFELNMPEVALREVTKLRKLQPLDPMAALLHALILSAGENTSESEPLLEDIAYQLSKVDVSQASGYRAYLASALLNKMQGKYDEALRNTRRYLSYVKNESTAIGLLGELLLLTGKPSEARIYLQDLFDAGNARPQDLLNLATVYRNLNQPQQYQHIINQAFERFPQNKDIRLRRAIELAQQGEYASALALLDDMPLNASDPQYELAIARLYFTLLHPETPSKISQLIASYPTLAQAHQLAGEYALKRGAVEDAKRYFNQALVIAENAPEPMLYLASLAMKNGDTAEVKQWLDKLESLTPDNMAVLGLLADFHIANRDFKQAIPYLRKRYDLKRNTQDAIALVDAHLQLNQVKLANDVLLQALRQHRLNPDLLHYQWLIAIHDKDWELGAKNLRLLADIHYDNKDKLALIVANQLDLISLASLTELKQEIAGNLHRLSELSVPSSVHALLTARYHLIDSDLDMALNVLSGATGNEADFLRYQILRAQSRWDKASELINQLYARAPDEYRQPFIAFLMETEALEQLESVLDAYVNSSLSDTSAILLYAALLAEKGKFDTAESILVRAARVNSSALIDNQLANLYLSQANMTRALLSARTAHEKAPDNPAVNDTLGWVLVKQGEAKEGLAYLRAAYAKASIQADVNYHLGEALLALGRHDDALGYLNTAVELGGNGGEQAAETLRRLQQHQEH